MCVSLWPLGRAKYLDALLLAVIVPDAGIQPKSNDVDVVIWYVNQYVFQMW